MPGGDEPGGKGYGSRDRNDAAQDRPYLGSRYFRAAIPVFQERIAEHENRKSDVPDLVKPGGCLRAGIEQPGRSKHTWKAQAVDDRSGRGEQISAREQQQRPRAQNRELRKQQDGGDEIVDRERGLITGNEGRHRDQRHPGIDRGDDEQNGRDADDGERNRCGRGWSPAGSIERCCVRQPSASLSLANWHRTRHRTSTKCANFNLSTEGGI